MDKLCGVPECGPTKRLSKGYCDKHYVQFRKGKLPEIKGETYIDRYWALVDKKDDTDECWPWIGCIRSNGSQTGYGRVRVGKKSYQAHRVGYSLANEIDVTELPSAIPVHHTCGNSICQNPNHLQATTFIENTAEMLERKYYKERINYLENLLKENKIDFKKGQL